MLCQKQLFGANMWRTRLVSQCASGPWIRRFLSC